VVQLAHKYPGVAGFPPAVVIIQDGPLRVGGAVVPEPRRLKPWRPKKVGMSEVVLGAALALIASVVVQLFVVPQVAALGNRRERWRATVASLGERLAFVEAEQVQNVKEALLGVVGARDIYGLPRDEIDDIHKVLEDDSPEAERHPWMVQLMQAGEKVIEAYDGYHRHFLQLGWLMTTLEADAPRGLDLGPSRAAYRAYSRSAVRLRKADSMEMHELTTLGEAGADTVAMHIDWYFAKHTKARLALLREIKRLLLRRAAAAANEDPYRQALLDQGLDPDDPNMVSEDDREHVGPFDSDTESRNL